MNKTVEHDETTGEDTPRLAFDDDVLSSQPDGMQDGRATIGRGEENTYVLSDPRVSRVHAQFDLRSGSAILEDLGSTAGTRVNGEALEGPRVLEHGDEISFGPVSCTFIAAGGGLDAGEATRVIEVPEVTAGPQLSPRQQQVLELIAEGMTNKEIGEQLGITERTVKAYAGELYTKLDVSNRAGAVAEGVRHGLLPGTR